MLGQEARVSDVFQCSWSNVTWVDAHIVHTLSLLWIGSYCCRQQHLQTIGCALKSSKLRMRVQHLCMNKNVLLVSCDSNVLVLSPQVTVYSGYLLLSTYSCGIRILSAKEYGVRPSPENNYWSCGMEFQKLFSTRCVHWALPIGGTVTQIVVSLHLASRPFPYSFQTPAAFSHCSAFLSCY